MKSLLVDALRQANNGNTSGAGQSLSDSGSFDTENGEFGETANDESVDNQKSISDELELLNMTGALIVSDDVTQENDTPTDAVFPSNELDREAIAPHNFNTHNTIIERAPTLARHTPTLCILLAILASGCWSIYQQVDIRYFRDVFASEQAQSGAANRSSVAKQTTYGIASERFPFLDVPLDREAENSDVSERQH